MVLYVVFADGSNPWVSLPTDRNTIAKHWKKWWKNTDAHISAHSGKYEVDYVCGEYWVLTRNDPRPIKAYKHLGHALAALEKLGGECK